MNRYVAVTVIILLLVPAALISYRVIALNYPLIPAAPERVWQLSFKATIQNENGVSSLAIALPSQEHGIAIIEEKLTESPLDFSIRSESGNRYATWTGKAESEGSVLSYSATFMTRSPYYQEPPQFKTAPLEDIRDVDMKIAEQLVSKILNLSPEAKIAIISSAITDNPDPENFPLADIEEWAEFRNKKGKVRSLLMLFRAANLYAQQAEGLFLKDSITEKTASWIEVWTGKSWVVVEPETGAIIRKTGDLLPLTKGNHQAVRIIKGELSDLRWIISRQTITKWSVQYENIKSSDRFLNRWSLFDLPSEYQGTFRILILVPIGALIICVLRNIIGLPTFGIFMPVLMALAFRNTGLVYGLGIFTLVLAIGYALRSFMDKLRLLLVPRLSVILTMVICCFIVFALAGNKIGIKELMAVGLLPFVILTLTIERFHIILEEQGPRHAFSAALGSAAVSSAAFAIIQFGPLQTTFFVFPELLLAVMALQILVGRYTGYRLMELLRFRQLGGDSDNKSL